MIVTIAAWSDFIKNVLVPVAALICVAVAGLVWLWCRGIDFEGG